MFNQSYAIFGFVAALTVVIFYASENWRKWNFTVFTTTSQEFNSHILTSPQDPFPRPTNEVEGIRVNCDSFGCKILQWLCERTGPFVDRNKQLATVEIRMARINVSNDLDNAADVFCLLSVFFSGCNRLSSRTVSLSSWSSLRTFMEPDRLGEWRPKKDRFADCSFVTHVLTTRAEVSFKIILIIILIVIVVNNDNNNHHNNLVYLLGSSCRCD